MDGLLVVIRGPQGTLTSQLLKFKGVGDFQRAEEAKHAIERSYTDSNYSLTFTYIREVE
jgi:hypothetical protein